MLWSCMLDVALLYFASYSLYVPLPTPNTVKPPNNGHLWDEQ